MVYSIICCHTRHLFQSPLCKTQSLVKRICNIIFHILTLGIPLGLYHIISLCCSSIKRFSLSPDLLLKYGEEAVLFSRNLLSKHKSLVWRWEDVDDIYVNQDVDRLVALFWERSFNNFKQALIEHPQDTWKNKEVLKAANELLKVSYAISEATWASIPLLIQSLGGNLYHDYSLNLSYRDLFMEPKLYISRTAYYCASVYAWIKAGVIWDERKDRFVFPNEDLVSQNIVISNNKNSFFIDIPWGNDSSDFYQKGAIQNYWRSLYNEYCENFAIIAKLDLRFLDEENALGNIPQKDDEQGIFQPILTSVNHVIQSFDSINQEAFAYLHHASSIFEDKMMYLDIKHSSEHAIQALSFSQTLLSQQVVEPWSWSFEDGVIKAPENEAISCLMSIYWNSCFENFKLALKNNLHDTWNSQEVLTAADQLLKVGFAISELTFDDLPLLGQYYGKRDNYEMSYTDLLVAENSTCYTVSACLNAYTWIRAGVVWDLLLNRFIFPNEQAIVDQLNRNDDLNGNMQDDINSMSSEEIEVLPLYKIRCPCIDSRVFYQEGSMQNNWRTIYNHYVDRFKSTLNSDILLDMEDGSTLTILEMLPIKDENENIEFQSNSNIFEVTINQFHNISQTLTFV